VAEEKGGKTPYLGTSGHRGTVNGEVVEGKTLETRLAVENNRLYHQTGRVKLPRSAEAPLDNPGVRGRYGMSSVHRRKTTGQP
jgi:hypothetical protein